MDDETLQDSVCAGVDLAARLAAEVAAARLQLLAAEKLYADAAQGGGPGQVPLGVRRDLRLCQHRLRVLDRIRADLLGGGSHARSA
ncbi:MAG: hypothetical protein U1E73_05055 [Planctomycetota bacterium]